jgi:hypothetical protein
MAFVDADCDVFTSGEHDDVVVVSRDDGGHGGAERPRSEDDHLHRSLFRM